LRAEVLANTLTDEATYKAMYQRSVVNPDGFWREQAKAGVFFSNRARTSADIVFVTLTGF
jgi:hypothetical protein